MDPGSSVGSVAGIIILFIHVHMTFLHIIILKICGVSCRRRVRAVYLDVHGLQGPCPGKDGGRMSAMQPSSMTARVRKAVLLVLACLPAAWAAEGPAPAPAAAAAVAAQDSRFAMGYLALGTAEAPLARGCARLLQELNARTQVDPAPEGAQAVKPDLAAPPPFLWIGVGPAAGLDEALVERLQRFLAAGGTVFAEPDGAPGSLERLRELAGRVFPGRGPEQLKDGDLLTRTFFFLAPATAPLLRARLEAGRVAWVDACVPVGRAMDVGARVTGGAMSDEEAVRLGVNMAVYTLTGSYKDDLTHLRYLFRRRKP